MSDADWGLPASGPTGSRKLLVSGLLILTAILVSAAVNLCRTGHLTSDQFSIGPMIQKSQDPELFARDPVYSDRTNYDFYLPYYRRLLGWLMQITGTVGLAYWLLMVGISAVTLFGFWLLYLDLKVRPTWAALGAILSALPRLAPGQEITGACLMETALPRTLLSMFLPLSELPERDRLPGSQDVPQMAQENVRNTQVPRCGLEQGTQEILDWLAELLRECYARLEAALRQGPA